MLALCDKTLFLRSQDTDLVKVVNSYPHVVMALEDFANVTFQVPEGHWVYRACSLLEVITSTFDGVAGFVKRLNDGLVIVMSESDYRSSFALVAVLLANTYKLTPTQQLTLINQLYLSDVLFHNVGYAKAEATSCLAHTRTLLDGYKFESPLEVDLALAVSNMKPGSVDPDTWVSCSTLPSDMVRWIINAVIHPLEPARWIHPAQFADMFEEHNLGDRLEEILALNYELNWEGMRELSFTLQQALDGLAPDYLASRTTLEQCWKLYFDEITFSEWLVGQQPFLKKYILTNENKYNLYLLSKEMLAA